MWIERTAVLASSEVMTMGRTKGSDYISECSTKSRILHAVIQACIDKITTGKEPLILLYVAIRVWQVTQSSASDVLIIGQNKNGQFREISILGYSGRAP